MFNSKKIKRIVDQQELLDAKINSLAHGQKSLAEDFEVHFKRLRQSIYTSVEEFSSELHNEMSELKKENERIKKLIENIGDKRIKLDKIENNQKHQSILFATKIQLLTDQISHLKNQFAKPIETPKTQEIIQPLGVAQAPKVPTWTMRSSPSEFQSSPIQDKMKLEVSEIFDDSVIKNDEAERRVRRGTTPIHERRVFSVNVFLPEKVLNYLHNRSAEKAISSTCRNIFERDGKLVFAPLSNEITKNFFDSTKKSVTICVSKNTYLAIRKIAKDLEMSMCQVASNFVATMDTIEANQVGLKYSEFNSKELKLNPSTEKRGKGRPKK